jgi:medium-chain acyl-[acyl-carrier-protein] hydrolase
MIIFERKYPVNIFNTDLTGRLSPGALFSFFEDLAGRHATVLGWGRDDMMTTGFFWALSRIVVKIERLPVAMDEVTLRTWPRGTEAIYALRDLEMYDEAGKRLVGASSSWVIVDYNTRRAQRPDKALSGLNAMFPEERALDTNPRKVPPIPPGDHRITKLRVRLDDIDVNWHVNNARYIHWATNCYDQEFIISHTPDIIEVNYLIESHLGDCINILTGASDKQDKSFIHSIMRESDSTELCRLRINWKENGL